MTHETAMALVCALFAEDTTDYGRVQHNGRFLDALRVAFPSLPSQGELKPYLAKRVRRKWDREMFEAREELGQIFRILAEAVADCEVPPVAEGGQG